MRVTVVIRYIGLVMQFIAAFMLASAAVSMLNDYDSAYYPLLLSSFMTALLGTFPLFFVATTVAQTTNGFLLNLAYTLTCEAKLLADLLQGHLRATNAEEIFNDILLTVGEGSNS